jgi:hypothetical protein
MKKLYKNQTGFAPVVALLVVFLLVVLGFAGYYVYHAQKTSNKTTTASNTAKSNTSETPSPRYISYASSGDPQAGGGIAILAASDVSKLTGASDKLKAYFTDALPNETCTPNQDLCPSSGVYVANTVVSTYGDFASVSVPDAAGVVGPDPVSGRIVWIMGGQDAPSCSALKQIITKYHIPSGFYAKADSFSCYPTDGSHSVVPYTSYKK